MKKVLFSFLTVAILFACVSVHESAQVVAINAGPDPDCIKVIAVNYGPDPDCVQVING